MKIRRVVSLTAALTFVTILVTSIVLFIVPEGRVAHWADWRMLGLNKEQWADIHTNLGFLFLITLCFHIYFNWKAIKTYLKTRTKEFKLFTREFNTAMALVLICFCGTYFYVAPFSSVLEFSASIKREASYEYGEPPFGGAQRSSLVSFANRLGLDLDRGLIQLKAAGFVIEDTSMTMLELAELNDTTPQQIYLSMISSEAPETSESQPKFEAPSSGFGKITLMELAQRYGADFEATVNHLQQRNSEISGDMKLKEVGELLGESPRDLFEELTGLETGDG